MTVDTARSTGVYAGVPFAATDPRPDAQRFVIAFRARFGMKPDNNAALAYDATRLLYQAYSDVGADRGRIRDWLATRTAATAYRGATGAIWFRADGDPVGKGVVMTRIERGVLRVVGGAT
jgi:branched-chain amino acid transport system substrate-binding protein